ncbi:hypothetical protein GCM10027090_39650 [Sinomonas soli]
MHHSPAIDSSPGPSLSCMAESRCGCVDGATTRGAAVVHGLPGLTGPWTPNDRTAQNACFASNSNTASPPALKPLPRRRPPWAKRPV